MPDDEKKTAAGHRPEPKPSALRTVVLTAGVLAGAAAMPEVLKIRFNWSAWPAYGLGLPLGFLCGLAGAFILLVIVGTVRKLLR